MSYVSLMPSSETMLARMLIWADAHDARGETEDRDLYLVRCVDYAASCGINWSLVPVPQTGQVRLVFMLPTGPVSWRLTSVPAELVEEPSEDEHRGSVERFVQQLPDYEEVPARRDTAAEYRRFVAARLAAQDKLEPAVDELERS